MSKTIRFNAGKVQYDEDTKKCKPLPHKGQVTIRPAADDGFYDFVWAPKSNSGLEKDELLIIPGDVTFKQVKSCRTGRVVALTFLSSGAKNLYWLQDVGDDDELDKLTEKDQELLTSVQTLVAADDEDDDVDETEVSESAGKSIAESGVSAGNSITESAGVSGVSAGVPGKSASESSPAQAFPIVSLEDVLTEQVILRHLDTLLESQLQEVYGHLLPESVAPTKAEIMKVVRSGFFHQANKELSQTVAENGVGQILASSFGYEYKGEGIEAFLRGIRLLKK